MDARARECLKPQFLGWRPIRPIRLASRRELAFGHADDHRRALRDRSIRVWVSSYPV